MPSSRLLFQGRACAKEDQVPHSQAEAMVRCAEARVASTEMKVCAAISEYKTAVSGKNTFLISIAQENLQSAQEIFNASQNVLKTCIDALMVNSVSISSQTVKSTTDVQKVLHRNAPVEYTKTQRNALKRDFIFLYRRETERIKNKASSKVFNEASTLFQKFINRGKNISTSERKRLYLNVHCKILTLEAQVCHVMKVPALPLNFDPCGEATTGESVKKKSFEHCFDWVDWANLVTLGDSAAIHHKMHNNRLEIGWGTISKVAHVPSVCLVEHHEFLLASREKRADTFQVQFPENWMDSVKIEEWQKAILSCPYTTEQFDLWTLLVRMHKKNGHTDELQGFLKAYCPEVVQNRSLWPRNFDRVQKMLLQEIEQSDDLEDISKLEQAPRVCTVHNDMIHQMEVRTAHISKQIAMTRLKMTESSEKQRRRALQYVEETSDNEEDFAFERATKEEEEEEEGEGEEGEEEEGEGKGEEEEEEEEEV